MDSSTKRKAGAIALIVAGIGAFLVPFLLHSPGLQASNNGGGNTNSNNNNGNPGKTPSGGCTTNCGPSGSGTNPSGCGDDDSADPNSGHTNQGKHLALGHDKQDASLVGKAQGFMHALGKHNPQHDATHSTKTDNHTTHSHVSESLGHDDDNSNCVDRKDNDDSDDEVDSD